MPEKNNTLNILSSRVGAMCGCTCRICYRQSVLRIWFSNLSFVYVFHSFFYPSVSALSLPVFFSHALYSLLDSFSLKLKL